MTDNVPREWPSQRARPFYQVNGRPPPRQVATQFVVGVSAGVLTGAVAGVLACAATEADFKLLDDRILAARRDLEEALPTWMQDEEFLLATHHLFVPLFPQVVDRRKAAVTEARSPKERLKGAWNHAIEKGTWAAFQRMGVVPPRMPP